MDEVPSSSRYHDGTKSSAFPKYGIIILLLGQTGLCFGTRCNDSNTDGNVEE
jgi:hypothetical protein